MSASLEIACFDAASALVAQRAGADRIELCVDRDAGGITPPLEMFVELRQQLRIPIYVMIRPRGGNFYYSEAEFEAMKNSIHEFKAAGADGFVFGLLTKEQQVDDVRNRMLVELAGDLPCSFHRAVDQCPSLDVALQQLISCGFKTVLSSGGTDAAAKGSGALYSLQQKYGADISVMPGGGIRSENLAAIKKETGCSWFHSSGIPSGKQTADLREIQQMKSVLA